MARPDKPGQVKPGEDGDVLARWSRRKLQARSGGVDLEQEPAAVSSPPEQTDADAAGPAPQLTDADMPPLESLTEDSDYTPFLSPGVSDGLRRLALRKLFSLPQFNIRDDLNDYDEDFSAFRPPGDLIPHEMASSVERALKKATDAGRMDEEEVTVDGQRGAAQASGIAESETQPEQNGKIAAEPGTGETLPKG